jgi:hypothetical protein
MSRLSLDEIQNYMSQTVSSGLKNQKKDHDLSVTNINNLLDGNMGEQDLGFFGNRALSSHERKAKLNATKQITSQKYELLTDLSIKSLKMEATLIQERLKIKWNTAYAVLAEEASVSEMASLRRLQSTLDAGREILYGDRNMTVERIHQRYEQGKLSENDYKRELIYLMTRFESLFQDFVDCIDSRRSNIKNVFGDNDVTKIRG